LFLRDPNFQRIFREAPNHLYTSDGGDLALNGDGLKFAGM